jgi:GTPase SAR1 family protein
MKDIYTGKVMDQKKDVDMQFTNELNESKAESDPDKEFALKSEKRAGLLDTLSDVMNVDLPKEFFADCAVWDFAGQKEFYATHQTFLTNSAIYLLTTDLSKELSSQMLTKIYDVDFGKVGCKYILLLDYRFMVFNATFNNISVISWR